MIVFDASTIVSAALKADSILERALLQAESVDVLTMSAAAARREAFLRSLRDAAIWFDPKVRVADCRDPKDHKYLELALAAGAEIIVSSDDDLLVLHPWREVRIVRPAEYLALL